MNAASRNYVRRDKKWLHRTIVEKALGHPIPDGAEVHHVNNDRGDPSNGNLVLCQDQAYHKLLHLRTRALDACGNANWRRCMLCHAYDAPANLSFSPSHQSGKAYHKNCARLYARPFYTRDPAEKARRQREYAEHVASMQTARNA